MSGPKKQANTHVERVADHEIDIHRQVFFCENVQLKSLSVFLSGSFRTDLEEGEEAIQLAFVGAPIKAHPACVKESADKSNTEVIVGTIDDRNLAR